MISGEFRAIPSLDRVAQRDWMRALRSRIAAIELVFHQGDDDHPLTARLAALGADRQVGVGPRPGYTRPEPAAVLHRYRYDREILTAIDELGGLFEPVTTRFGESARFTALGDVDVVFLDSSGRVIGATVTHEGLILVLAGESG